MYYPAHGRDYYDSWTIWEAAREDERYGSQWINNVWTNATEDQMRHEFIIDRMIRLDSSGSADKAGAINDLWGEMAKKCVTMDYERQQFFQQILKTDDGSDWYYYQRTRTPLVKVPGTTGQYRAARSHIPMEFGFNTIPLEALPGTTVSCTFQPQCDPVRQSDWRACLVAVNANGDAQYSSLWNSGVNSIKVSADDEKLYLVVIATPKPMKIPDPTWAAYKSDAGLQFPYMLSFSNTEPKNVTWPVPGVSHTRHPNGGGFVQSGAAVDATAFVGTNAMVLDNAQVRGNARIEDYAVVRDNTQVRDNAVVSGHAVVQDNAQVYDNATIRDWARVFGHAEIYENAKVIEHANCGDGSASTHTKVYGNAVVKGTTYVYNPSTFATEPVRLRTTGYISAGPGDWIQGGLPGLQTTPTNMYSTRLSKTTRSLLWMNTA
jgi:carbonic anhydrase/acetyltransferase-like protein (isoleucine patch superfamily)